jgi:hypothetical protein
VGRWTAKDPIRFAAKQTNSYAYAENDPINKRDPSGTNWLWEICKSAYKWITRAKDAKEDAEVFGDIRDESRDVQEALKHPCLNGAPCTTDEWVEAMENLEKEKEDVTDTILERKKQIEDIANQNKPGY